MRRHILGLVFVSMLLAANAQAAPVQIQVNIGSPPRMVYLAEPAVYAVVGTPYDIYYAGNRYYYAAGNNWYSGPRYNGPFTVVAYRSLPPGLRNFKVEKLRYYRDRDWRDDHGRGRGRGHYKH